MDRAIPFPKRGFTLLELMVSVAIFAFLVAGVLTSFLAQRNALKQQKQMTVMQQNVRSGLDMVVNDIKMAGYGIHVSDFKLPQWVDWVSGLNGNPTVTQGSGTSPDSITIIGAFDAAPAELAAPTLYGANTIVLRSGDGIHFNTSDRKVIFIGRLETARVVGKSGDSLVISTDPVASRGLKNEHASGSPVELVQAITYSWVYDPDKYPFSRHLQRVDHAGAYYADWQKITSDNIEDFQIIKNPYSIEVSVTGRTEYPDRNYVHPTENDHYRRTTLNAKIAPRNARLKF